MDTHTAFLLALFDLARTERPATLERVMQLPDVSEHAARNTAQMLELLGLIDARRLRLTMPGLVIAARAASTRRVVQLPLAA